MAFPNLICFFIILELKNPHQYKILFEHTWIPKTQTRSKMEFFYKQQGYIFRNLKRSDPRRENFFKCKEND